MSTAAIGFGRLWTSSLLSNLSDGFRAAAFPLLAATLTRDPLLVAGVTVAQELPWVLAGPFMGEIVDRVDRRLLMWSVNMARALVFGVVAASVVVGVPSLWLLYIAAFLLGIGESVYDNASQAAVPMLVTDRGLERANGRLVAAQVVGNEFVGPPLGALLFGIAIVIPFGVGSASLLAATILIVGLAGSFRPADLPEASRGVRRRIGEGFRFLTQNRQLSAITIGAGLLAFADAAWFAVLVLYAIEVLGVNEVGFGVLLAIGAVGGVTGALAADRIAQRLRTRWTLTGTLALSAVTQLLLWTADSPVFATALIAVSSFSFGIWNVVAVSARQRLTPSRLLGRVNATYHVFSVGAAPLGALAGGIVAQHWGTRAPFLIGVPILLTGVMVTAIRLR